MRFYIGATIAIVGIILLALGNITAIGEFVYNSIKTDLSFLTILWESIKTWFLVNIVGWVLIVVGLIIRGDN